MTQNGSRRQPDLGDNSSLILGILIGVVLGLAVAGGMAWYLTHKHPDVYARNEDGTPAQHADTSVPKPPVATGKQPAQNAGTALADKNNYTFYKLLPDGKQGHNPPPAANGSPSGSSPAGRANAGKTYYLQAGSFTNEKEANSLRQKLAFLGLETHVLTADIPGKGLHYRVRLGPYHSTDEMNKANQTLKQNGVPNAAQIRNP